MRVALTLLVTLCVLLPAARGAGAAARFRGRASYYAVGLGACGWISKSSDLVVAVSPRVFDPGPRGAACGRRLRVSYAGRSITARVVDRCAGCKREDIDLSRAAFSKLAQLSAGVIVVQWQFAD